MTSPAATRSAKPGDAETAAGPAGEAGSAADSEAALEWLETTTAHIWQTWGSRYPSGRDW